MIIALVSAALAAGTQAGFLLPGALPAPAGSATAGAFIGTVGLHSGWAGLEGSFAPSDRTALVGFLATPIQENETDLGVLAGGRVLAWTGKDDWIRIAPLVAASGEIDVDHGNTAALGFHAGVAVDAGTRHVRVDASTTLAGVALVRTEWTALDEPALVAAYVVGPRMTEVGLRVAIDDGRNSWRIAGPTPLVSYRHAEKGVFFDVATGWIAVGTAVGARF